MEQKPVIHFSQNKVIHIRTIPRLETTMGDVLLMKKTHACMIEFITDNANRDLAKASKRGGPPFFLEQILFDVVIRMC